MFCTKCGATLEIDDVFCSKCGARVKAPREEMGAPAAPSVPSNTLKSQKTDCPACGSQKASAEGPCEVCGFRPLSSGTTGSGAPERTPHGAQSPSGHEAASPQELGQHTPAAPPASPSGDQGPGRSTPRQSFVQKWANRQLDGYSTLPWYETARGDAAIYGFGLAGICGYTAYLQFTGQHVVPAGLLAGAALVVAAFSFLSGRGHQSAMAFLAVFAVVGAVVGWRVLSMEDAFSRPEKEQWSPLLFAIFVGPLVLFQCARAYYIEKRLSKGWFFD